MRLMSAHRTRTKKASVVSNLLQQLACQNVLVLFGALLTYAVISATVCPLGQMPGLYVAVPYFWHWLYDASETIDFEGLTDQTTVWDVLSVLQEAGGTSIHLSTHDGNGVNTVVRSATFIFSSAVDVPKGVTKTSL